MIAAALHDAIVKAGGRPSGPPQRRPYAMKDFDITDPDGNRICFGESCGQ